MKKIIGLLFLFLFGGTFFVTGASKQFFITTSANNREASAYAALFESTVFNAFRKEFSCIEILSITDVAILLEWERQAQVLGVGREDAIENIAAAMGSDYLISLKVNVQDGKTKIDAFCANSRTTKVVSRGSAVATGFEATKDAITTITQQLIDGLSQIEICPFTGPVSITISSVLDSTKTDDYDVYCNEMDQQYHHKLEINNATFSDWKLQRKAISRTEGTMTFNSSELSKVTEENGCYKCKSGREGGRTYTETRSMRVNGSGISHESSYKGKPQDDTRIELKFLENGTYLLIAKGTSLPAKCEDKVVASAVGTCDNIPQNTKLEPGEISIPLKVIFGPYPGKTTDKLLQQKDSKVVKDPVTKEKQTISIDFSLNQKDK